jgi:hypothetical protein
MRQYLMETTSITWWKVTCTILTATTVTIMAGWKW